MDHKLLPRLRTLNLSGDRKPSERVARNQIKIIRVLSKPKESLVQDVLTRVDRKLGTLRVLQKR